MEDENACVFYDPVSGETFEYGTVPRVHLAEAIATDWWSILERVTGEEK